MCPLAPAEGQLPRCDTPHHVGVQRVAASPTGLMRCMVSPKPHGTPLLLTAFMLPFVGSLLGPTPQSNADTVDRRRPGAG